MNKKTILIGLSVSALMTATIATAIGNKDNIKAFAEDATPGVYTAVIDSSNKLIESNDHQRYGFRLHGGEEYGFFYTSKEGRLNNNPTEEYSDYAFAWNNTDGEPYYFEIFLKNDSTTYSMVIDGKNRTLREFPGTRRIITVYKNPNNIYVDSCRPNSSWGHTKSVDEQTGLITEIATAPVNNSTDMAWCTRAVGTIYIKSITIEYYCS